jgi:23S rRNA pseudouridine2605 synthase
MRIQKYLSACGVCSRRKAEEYLLAGKITVNGKVVRELGTTIDPETDVVCVNGVLVQSPQKPVTVALYKPRRVISAASDDRGRECVTDYVPPELGRLYPVGRLDYDSEGLILLTNDGTLANFLTHPKYHVPKTYLVTVSGAVSLAALDKLRKGVIIDGNYRTKPCQAQIIEQTAQGTRLKITLYEGKNQQIRKMMKAVSHPVTRLIRIEIGHISLGNLKSGQWRHLTNHELRKLKAGGREENLL